MRVVDLGVGCDQAAAKARPVDGVLRAMVDEKSSEEVAAAAAFGWGPRVRSEEGAGASLSKQQLCVIIEENSPRSCC